MAGRLRAGHRIDVDNGPTAGVAADEFRSGSSTRPPAAALVGACPLQSVWRWETAPVGSSAPVVATIGDGSFQYSVQAIWTAVQHDLPIVFVVMRNEEYPSSSRSLCWRSAPASPAWTCLASTLSPSQPDSDAEQCMQTPPNSSPSSSRQPYCPGSHCYRCPDPA